MVEVRGVPAAETFPLRRAVLRPHQTIDDLAHQEHGFPGSEAYAVVDEAGHVIATGTVGPRAPAWQPEPDGAGWQVRGMAVAPDRRGRGLGSAVLAALLDHVRARGGGVVWCNARVAARGVYEHAGFEAVGDVFDIDGIGAHIVMARRVDPSAPSAPSAPS